MSIADIGPRPQAFNLEAQTLENPNFRAVAWSGEYLQVTLMSIPVNGDIGLENHGATDQFIRLDRGRIDGVDLHGLVPDVGDVVPGAGRNDDAPAVGYLLVESQFVLAGSHLGSPTPQHHTSGKVQPTKAVADTDTDDDPADWSVQPDKVADQHG